MRSEKAGSLPRAEAWREVRICMAGHLQTYEEARGEEGTYGIGLQIDI